MLRQTRNALIYSDLALFILDSREGLTYNDVALYKWLHYHRLRLPKEQRQVFNSSAVISEEERYALLLKEEERFNKTVNRDLQLGNV
jgi:predicted GTPase